MKPLLIVLFILLLTGCQTPPSPSPSSMKTSLSDNVDNIPPEQQQAWQFLRQLENSRSKNVNAYRVCHINPDNSVSDLFYEQGKSFMDTGLPAWKDGETISSISEPQKINVKIRKLGAMWAVQMTYKPDTKYRCQLNDDKDVCSPSWCNLTMSSGKIKADEVDYYLARIANQVKLLGMQVVYE